MNLKKMAPKDWITTGLSVAAFVLSSFAFYTTSLRVVDDVRVVVSGGQLADPNFEKKQFEIYPTDTRFIFINAGSRGAIISNISLVMGQSVERMSKSEPGCHGSAIQEINFDTQPFVLRPGDMLTKDAELVSTGKIKKEVRIDKREFVVVPFSELNAKSEKVWFKLCTLITYTTPSIEYGSTMVNEFEDELDPSVVGYTLFSEENSQPQEHRPIQLIKRSWIIFFD
jgi:hypothetical protein